MEGRIAWETFSGEIVKYRAQVHLYYTPRKRGGWGLGFRYWDLGFLFLCHLVNEAHQAVTPLYGIVPVKAELGDPL